MRRLLTFPLLAVCLATGSLSIAAADGPPTTLPGGWKLAWNDEFNGKSLNMKKWSYELGVVRNVGASQTYVKEAVKLKNGKLVITTTAKDTPCSTYKKDAKNWREKIEKQPYASGSITTQGKMSFKPGCRLEIRARIPKAKGSWPAIWLLNENGWGWPASGEIDIMEHITQEPDNCYSTFHWGKNGGTVDAMNTNKPVVEGMDSKWHVYSMEWDDKVISIRVDGVESARQVINAITYPDGRNPFRHPAYLIINTAVGGKGTWPEAPDASQYPCVFEVDYVRYYVKGGKK